MAETTRRDLLRMLAGGAAAAALAAPARASRESVIRAAVVVPAAAEGSRAVLLGARMGAEEAGRTGQLLGRSFELETAEVAGPSAAAAAGRRLAAEGATAVLGGVDAGCCDALAEALPGAFLEVRARAETELERGAGARRLRVTPAYEDYARALVVGLRSRGFTRCAFLDDDPICRRQARAAGLREVEPGEAEVLFARRPREVAGSLLAGVTLPPGRGRAFPVAWHPGLARYGAGELNERFRTFAGRPMDGAAWAGWLAVKLVLEAELRGRALGAVRIDGHKGEPLAFEHGRLRQPLYTVVRRDREDEVIDA